MFKIYRGMFCAHFLASVFTVPRVVAVCKSGIEFQILAIKLEGSVLQPDTGGLIFLDSASLVFFLFSFSEKSRVPRGFIVRAKV